jgi:hypothetical protein
MIHAGKAILCRLPRFSLDGGETVIKILLRTISRLTAANTTTAQTKTSPGSR